MRIFRSTPSAAFIALMATAAANGAAARTAAAQGAGAMSDTTPMPSAVLPPALDRVLRDYEQRWRAKDAAGVAALFAPDGFVLQGGRNPVRGRDAIQRAYTGVAGGDLSLRAFAYATSGNTGYIVGGYRYGAAASDVGKFTLTLRRDGNGPWLIFSDMDNGNQPTRRPPG